MGFCSSSVSSVLLRAPLCLLPSPSTRREHDRMNRMSKMIPVRTGTCTGPSLQRSSSTSCSSCRMLFEEQQAHSSASSASSVVHPSIANSGRAAGAPLRLAESTGRRRAGECLGNTIGPLPRHNTGQYQSCVPHIVLAGYVQAHHTAAVHWGVQEMTVCTSPWVKAGRPIAAAARRDRRLHAGRTARRITESGAGPAAAFPFAITSILERS